MLNIVYTEEKGFILVKSRSDYVVGEEDDDYENDRDIMEDE